MEWHTSSYSITGFTAGAKNFTNQLGIVFIAVKNIGKCALYEM